MADPSWHTVAMNLPTFSLRSPIVQFRSALALAGLRTEEDYDELIQSGPDAELRLSLSRLGDGQLVQCFISFDESRLSLGALGLFDQLSAEGSPVVAYGFGRGQVTFEFEWLHTDRSEWRISARRVYELLQRLRAALGPCPLPAHRAPVRRLSPELLDGVLARVVTAA